MTLPHQDPVIAGALGSLQPPPAADDFWIGLDDRLAPLDAAPHEAVALPSVRWSRRPTDTPVGTAALRPDPAPRRWPWRAAAAAAVVVLVAAFAVARGPGWRSVRFGGPPPVTGSPVEVFDAYVTALQDGDRGTAEALIGPRAAGEASKGEPIPFEKMFTPLDPSAGGRRVVFPDNLPAHTLSLSLNKNYTLLVVRPDEIIGDAHGATKHRGSQYRITSVLWREDLGYPWLVEGFMTGYHPPAAPPDSTPNYRAQPAMQIPEEGHSWMFLDGRPLAEASWTGPTLWQLPPAPGLNPPPSEGAELTTVFIGPHQIQADSFLHVM
jgi:hypothetical protein